MVVAFHSSAACGHLEISLPEPCLGRAVCREDFRLGVYNMLEITGSLRWHVAFCGGAGGIGPMIALKNYRAMCRRVVAARAGTQKLEAEICILICAQLCVNAANHLK